MVNEKFTVLPDFSGCCHMRTGNYCSRALLVSSLSGMGLRIWSGGPAGGGALLKDMLRAMSSQRSQNPTFNQHVALDQVRDDPRLFQDNTCLSSC